MKHSLLSASAADRWTACPGSVPMSQGIEDSAGAAALEGTALHEVTTACLEKDLDAYEFDRIKFHSDGRDHDVELNDEQREAVQEVVDYVRGIEGSQFYELTVSYGRAIGQPENEAFGTTDIASLIGTHCDIIDAKFGRRFVGSFQNKQMLLYGIGTVDALEALGDEVTTIGLHIAQPRVGGKVAGDPWVITRDELEVWIDYFKERAEAVQQAIDTYKPHDAEWQNEYLNPGELQCMYCRAAGACPKLRAIANNVGDMMAETEDFLGEFHPVNILDQMPPAQLSLALTWLPLLDTFAKATTKEAFKRLGEGKDVPDYKLIKGRQGHRRWADEAKAKAKAEELGATPAAMYGEPKLKTPAQMQSVFKILLESTTAEAAAAVDALVVRNPAKPTLAKSEVPGEAWVGSADAAEFGLE